MSQMSCTIGAPAPVMYSSSAGAFGGPATSGGGPAAPTGALDGAVAGSRGGAVSSTGGGGTAVAGAAGALGSEQLMPVLQQLTAAIEQLTAALQPAAAQAPATPPADEPLNSNTAGVSGGGATTPTACGCAGTSSPTPAPTEPPAPRGANAAPRAAAPPPPAPPPADVSRWVTGDTKGLDQDLLGKLAQLGERMGQNVFIKSGNRTHKQQEDLYRKYLNGTGNKAARPGTSNHEHGDAADAQIDGKNLASNPKALKIATELGLHFPVRGEPWHVEVK